MGRLDDRVALITGAAMGIGRACAERLASEGAKVVITDIEDHTGQETAVAFRAKGYTANFIQQDVTSEGQWQSVLADIDRLHGRLDILVNNAGIAIRKSIFEMTMDEYQLQNSINLDGVFMGLKYGIPMIAKTEGGSVINLSSVAGLKASPGLSAYAMTKGGVRLLSKSVAKECIAEGIKVRVNSVHPGIIQTAIWDKMGVPTDGENQVDVEQLATNAVPGGLLGKPTDIADGVLFLASDESRYVNGSELVIDHAISA